MIGAFLGDLPVGQEDRGAVRASGELHRQLNRYAYGPATTRFTETDVDQAHAAGVVIEFQDGRPIIVDRSLYRERVKGAI